ncbi:hypothetical protein [Paraburkholderia phytofirmans]|uniref:hypothetical protein n=1 Tax=Paraburkholderia phytofirmans TaxID=261302 RepID=UPI0038BD9872
MDIGSALLALSVWAGVLLAFARRWAVSFLLMIVVIAPFEIRDAAFTIPAFLFLVACVRVGLPARDVYHLPANLCTVILLALASLSIGLVPLVKGSFAGIAAVQALLGFVALIWGRRFGLAALVVIVPAVAMITAWCWCGQPVEALPAFFIAQSPIISGYTEAMSYPGPAGAVVFYAIASLIVVACIWRSWKLPLPFRVIATLGALLYLFVSFKAGFIRQDAHTIIGAGALLLVTIWAASLVNARAAITLLLISALCAYSALPKTYPLRALRDVSIDSYRSMVGAALHPPTADDLRAAFRAANQAIAAQTPLPTIQGTVDIYPVDLSAIFANDLAWSGRPVFQSYSAYTPALEAANAQHLLGATAPDTIFFDISPIDGRLAALDEASSWPILRSRYTVSEIGRRFVVMKRRSTAAPGEPSLLSEGTFSLSAPIAVPRSDQPVVAKVGITQSLLGRMLSTVFRSPIMQVELTLDNGTVVTRRYIPAMGTNGFVISPFVESNESFVRMAQDGANQLRVKSVRFVSDKPQFWSRQFHVEFLELAPAGK